MIPANAVVNRGVDYMNNGIDNYDYIPSSPIVGNADSPGYIYNAVAIGENSDNSARVIINDTRLICSIPDIQTPTSVYEWYRDYDAAYCYGIVGEGFGDLNNS